MNNDNDVIEGGEELINVENNKNHKSYQQIDYEIYVPCFLRAVVIILIFFVNHRKNQPTTLICHHSLTVRIISLYRSTSEKQFGKNKIQKNVPKWELNNVLELSRKLER